VALVSTLSFRRALGAQPGDRWCDKASISFSNAAMAAVLGELGRSVGLNDNGVVMAVLGEYVEAGRYVVDDEKRESLDGLWLCCGFCDVSSVNSGKASENWDMFGVDSGEFEGVVMLDTVVSVLRMSDGAVPNCGRLGAAAALKSS